MLYESCDTECINFVTQQSRLIIFVKSLTLEHTLVNEYAVEYINHKKKSEEYLHPEMGKDLTQELIVHKNAKEKYKKMILDFLRR